MVDPIHLRVALQTLELAKRDASDPTGSPCQLNAEHATALWHHIKSLSDETRASAVPTFTCVNCGTVDEFSVQHDTLPGGAVVPVVECHVCEQKAYSPDDADAARAAQTTTGYCAHGNPESAVCPACEDASLAQTTGDGISPNYILPCDVKLPPNTIVGKGCKLSTLMTVLGHREGVHDIPRFITPPVLPTTESKECWCDDHQGTHIRCPQHGSEHSE